MATSRMRMKTRTAALIFACSFIVSQLGLLANILPAAARTMVPEAVLKKPVSVVENSVSTYVPSSVAPGNGIAVNVIYPEKPRYKAGAPIAVVVSGNESTSLSMSMHAANCGIAEVRFAYPGCGMRQFHSDGIFDNFGDSCSTALKDVVLFMKGEINDYKGRTVRELIPVSLDQSVVGMVAWETGANMALVTLAKHHDKIPFVSYLAFFEGAAGSMFYPDNLGTVKDMFLNRHYREGSAATGEILVDYRRLMYSSNARRHPGVAKKRGEAEIKGVLYFDENGNKVWDEAAEYALSYASEVGLDKQIYAPPIVDALVRHGVFVKSIPPPQEQKTDTAKKDKNGKDIGKGKDNDKDKEKDKDKNDSKDKADGKDKAVSDGKDKVEKKPRKKEWWEIARWPAAVALPKVSKQYFDARDGALYIKQVCETYPKLLVGLFGARIAHTQRQADHPHIALLYNKFLEAKPKWLRLNPEPVYVSTICRMNVANFNANEPNAAIDAVNIVDHLAPLGLVPEYAYMDALVAELSDRAKSGNLKHPLASMLSDYTPIADPSKVPPKTDPKPDAKPKAVGAKEAEKEQSSQDR
jgi:hypothetical protein